MEEGFDLDSLRSE
jgi:hypothetical protein